MQIRAHISYHVEAIVVYEVTVVESQHRELVATRMNELHEGFCVHGTVWTTPGKV